MSTPGTSMKSSGSFTKEPSLLALHAGGIALALVAGAACYMLVLGPAQARRELAQQRASQIESTRRSLESTQASLLAGERELASLRASLAESVLLQPATQINRRIRDITNAASAAGVVVRDITPKPRVAESRDYQVVPVSLVGQSSLPNVLKYLSTHTHDFRDIEVRELKLQSAPNQPRDTVDISLELAWYTLPDPVARAVKAERDDRAGSNDAEGSTAPKAE